MVAWSLFNSTTVSNYRAPTQQVKHCCPLSTVHCPSLPPPRGLSLPCPALLLSSALLSFAIPCPLFSCSDPSCFLALSLFLTPFSCRPSSLILVKLIFPNRNPSHEDAPAHSNPKAEAEAKAKAKADPKAEPKAKAKAEAS